MQQDHQLHASIRSLIESYFSCLRRPVRKNLARLTCAFLHLAWSIRFGYGGLHLTSIARVLPEGKKFKSSYKWLSRFLKCKYFDASSLAECMLAVILGNKPPGWVIVLVDQTTVNGVEVVNAAIPFQGRAVPVAWVDFEYPWKTVNPASQNTIERYLLTWLGLAVPRGVRLILIFDRGYARVELIKDLKHGQQPFLIRARRKVIVRTKVRGRQRRLSLGRLPHRMGRPLRYRHVLYHSQKAEPVDVIVYRGKGFQEPCRSETVTTTPAFRDSILTKRCLIPADGFYEWRKMGSVKQPYCFEVGEGEVFAFAGLWDEWRSPDGEIIESYTILTTGPNSLVADLHDRMPVIVTPDKYDVWLDPDVNDFNTIRDTLKPCDASLMRRYPVSRRLNNSKIDDAEAASPLTIDTPTQGQLF